MNTTKENTLFEGLKKRLINMALAVAGVLFAICWIPDGHPEIGYTHSGKQIYVSRNHPIMNGLDKMQKYLYIMGVFAHELMHQLLTAFNVAEQRIASLTAVEGKIFLSIFNILEDPAIEFHACKFIGGILLKALHFTIEWIYKQTPPIDTTADPFTQWMNAFIQYGDGGYVKGKIADSKAREIFFQTLPLFDKGIEEPDGAKRVAIAEEIFNLTRPLWEEQVKEMEKAEQLLKSIKETMKESGKTTRGSSDGPLEEVPEDSTGTDEASEKKRRRRVLTAKSEEGLEEVDATEEDDGHASGSKTSEEESGDTTESTSGSADTNSETIDAGSEKSEDDAEKGNGEESSVEDSTSDSEKTPESGKEGEDGFGEMKPEKAPDHAKPLTSHSTPSEPGGSGIDTDATDHDAEDLMETDTLVLTEEDLSDIETAMEEDLLSSDEMEDIKLNAEGGVIGSADLDNRYHCRCINLNVKDESASLGKAYQSRVNKMSSGIQTLTKQLERLFRNAKDEKIYRQVGQVSVKRLKQSRRTARVFTKRKESAVGDICIELVVDVSGSMTCFDRINHARDTAIALSEVCVNMNIPFKVIAFTADNYVDGNYYDVIHYHYGNFRNDKSRMALASMNACWNNFDGYSIRYAANVLKKRKEDHKLMIVISDGQPACNSYRGRQGIADTKNAIKEASKTATVIGVAIGGDRDVLFEMYGRGFVNIHNTAELFEQLGSVIKKEIKSWE